MTHPRVEQTWLDRAVAFVSPSAGRARLLAKVQTASLSGYVGARRDRRATSEWRAPAASADADTLPNLSVLRARSRDLVRNDPLAQSAVSTKVAHVVGAGHVVRPEIDVARLGLSEGQGEAWEDEALRVWLDWATSRDADVTRSQTFAELEDLVYRSRLTSGDVFWLPRMRQRPGRLIGFAVHVVEADRVSNPQWRMDSETLAGGIELDRDGAPVAYHIANRHEIDRHLSGATEWRRIPAFQGGRRLVHHVHGPRLRPDMTRFAPMLAPVIEALKQRSRYSEAELMAAVVSACFAIGLKSDDGDLAAGLEGQSQTSSGSADIRITEPGQIFDLLPGESVQSFAPGRPNPQFAPFIDAVAREVGAGTDLPQELLVKQFQASYSASKAAMEMAWLFFRADRALHVAQFCQPVYEEVISEAVARGVLSAAGFFTDPLRRKAWLGAVWMGPSRPSIDPTKDAVADQAYLDMGATSLTRITAERFGQDVRAVRRRRALDGSADARPQAAVAAPAREQEPETGTDREIADAG